MLAAIVIAIVVTLIPLLRPDDEDSGRGDGFDEYFRATGTDSPGGGTDRQGPAAPFPARDGRTTVSSRCPFWAFYHVVRCRQNPKTCGLPAPAPV